MTNTVIRIPNLPIGKMVDDEGNPTTGELTFRNALVSSLQNYVGNEGLVAPTQLASDITVIQNNQLSNNEYTCAFGTIIYDSTNNSIRIAVNNGSGAPVFLTVTLT
jgi:hypothetical protein